MVTSKLDLDPLVKSLMVVSLSDLSLQDAAITEPLRFLFTTYFLNILQPVHNLILLKNQI